MRFKKRFLSKPKKKVVTYLSDSQRGISDYESRIGKRICVLHYHEPYVWDIYIQLLDLSKSPTKKNRIIWYPFNFQKKVKPKKSKLKLGKK